MLFVSLCLYLIEQKATPTLGDVFDLAHQKDLRTWCRNCMVNEDVQHPLFENLVQDIIDGEKETVSNIITSFRTSLKCLALPSVRRATSRHIIDIMRLREKKVLCGTDNTPNTGFEFTTIGHAILGATLKSINA